MRIPSIALLVCWIAMPGTAAAETFFEKKPLGEGVAMRVDLVTVELSSRQAVASLNAYDGVDGSGLIGTLEDMAADRAVGVVARLSLETKDAERPSVEQTFEDAAAGAMPVMAVHASAVRRGRRDVLVHGAIEHHYPVEDEKGAIKYHSTMSLLQSRLRQGNPTLVAAVPRPRLGEEREYPQTLFTFCRVQLREDALENLSQKKEDEIVVISTVAIAGGDALAKWKKKEIDDDRLFRTIVNPHGSRSMVLANYMGVAPHSGRVRCRTTWFGDGSSPIHAAGNHFECDPESVASLKRNGEETLGAESGVRFAYESWRRDLGKATDFTLEARFHDLKEHWEKAEKEGEKSINWSHGAGNYLPVDETKVAGIAHLEEEEDVKFAIVFFTRAFVVR